MPVFNAAMETTGDPVKRWLWHGAVGLMATVLLAILGLVIALALGWNSPRPASPPDWQPSALPLTLEAPSDETVAALLGHPIGDFTLEVQAAPLSGPDLNGYGVLYRAQDAAHYYAFAIAGDGYYAVLQVADDGETSLVEWQQFPHIQRGQQANRLRVTCRGPTCHFHINDEYATTVEDTTWLSGDVGLWVRSFGEGDVEVRCVDVRVWTKE